MNVFICRLTTVKKIFLYQLVINYPSDELSLKFVISDLNFSAPKHTRNGESGERNKTKTSSNFRVSFSATFDVL